MLVVTLPANHAENPLSFAEEAKRRGADILEIRGDLTPGLAPFTSPLPILAAPRGRDLHALLEGGVFWVDLELDEKCSGPMGPYQIRSFHDYEKTPNTQTLVEMARALEAQLPQGGHVKVATFVRNAQDLLALREAQEAMGQLVSTTFLGMGPKSWPNRIMSLWRNSLSYVAMEVGGISAPGQLLLDDCHTRRQKPEPQLFAILGGEKLQSASPLIHNGLMERHGINGFYGSWPTDDLLADFEALDAFGFAGFSVTAPHKVALCPLIPHLELSARETGAVNTCAKREDGWHGWQKDPQGIVEGYPQFRGAKSAAVVGSGGVLSSVVLALRELGVETITIYARNEKARRALAKRFDAHHAPLGQLGKASTHLLVWALPMDLPDLSLPKPEGESFAIDLRYGKETDFLRRASDLGYHGVDGEGMLKAQALAQFREFSGELVDESDRDFLNGLLSDHGQQ